MRSQLRLQVMLPVAVLGLLGASFSAFGFGGTPPVDEPVASASVAKPAAKEKPAKPKRRAERQASRSPLERALARNRVVVALFYAPGSSYDTLQTREARAGALAAGAGFLAVDVSDDRAVASFAADYEVRSAPAILVFERGPRVAARIDGYADRETVAQAATNAKG